MNKAIALLLRYKAPLILIAILAAFAWYAAGYIESTSFVVEGKHYYVLFDDAMVSMRYAWNLAHGNGAVWNVGERIEGFTNPLWMLYMALWHLLPIESSQISLPIQISGAVFLGLNLVVVYKIVRYLTDDTFALIAALVMIAFYGPLDIWGLLGMEVSVLAFLLSLAVWIALTLQQGFDKLSPEALGTARDLSRWIPWLYALLGAATLIRIDMAVPFVGLLAFELWADKERCRQHLLWGLGMLIGFLGAQELVRLWYYGDLLPNTYYLKMENFSTAIRIARGIWVLFELAWQMNWVVFLLPLAIFIFRRDKSVALLALLFAGQVAYSTYVGGDAWEHKGGANRFIATALPLWFALFGVSLASLRKAVETHLQLTGKWWALALTQVVALLLLGFSLWNANFLVADYKSIDRWMLQRKPVYIAANEKYVQTALILERITTPDAKIAVTAAGTETYFLPDHYVIDLLGKVDKVIAHEPLKAPVSLAGIADVRPGHMKWDYAYSIGQLQPDVIVQLWEEDYKSAEPFLVDYTSVTIDGIPLFLRKNSAAILWDRVK